MTPEQTLDWLAQQHFDQCREDRPVQHWIRGMKSELPEQEPDYKEALRVLSLALEEAPQNLTPKQRSVWQQSKDVLLSGGGLA
jgi:hypothetical protein